MILEHAQLSVIAGTESKFEQAFSKAKKYIMRQKGCISLNLHRGTEAPNTYLLFVHWETIENHEIGFRKSADYQKWRKFLHRFYTSFLQIMYFKVEEK